MRIDKFASSSDQAPDRFAAAAARNPVCNLALMVGTTDIPDWCFFEAFGKSIFTECPSAEHLALFYNKSPISHISEVWILKIGLRFIFVCPKL